jgi:hypothetical protein
VSDAYVFLGAALPTASALAELDAVYLPPAAEGDVTRLLSRQPRVIVIADRCGTGAADPRAVFVFVAIGAVAGTVLAGWSCLGSGPLASVAVPTDSS